MRTAPVVLLALAIACEGLAYWGLATDPGRRAFDEMAGMIPVAAAAMGLLLSLAALIVWWRAGRAR